MIDVVREATVVPLPLQFAMIAQRAGAAIQVLEQGQALKEQQRRALQNAAGFLQQALEGKGILSGLKPGVYNPEAMSAYEVTEGVKEFSTSSGHDFLEDFQSKIKALLDNCVGGLPKGVADLRKFFQQLSEWCLSQNVDEIERVQIDVP